MEERACLIEEIVAVLFKRKWGSGQKGFPGGMINVPIHNTTTPVRNERSKTEEGEDKGEEMGRLSSCERDAGNSWAGSRKEGRMCGGPVFKESLVTP